MPSRSSARRCACSSTACAKASRTIREQATYRWNGALYAHAAGGMRDVGAFSVHPFEGGDYIIQTVPAKRDRITEYAVMHKLAEGVFQVVPVDEDDADDPTRAALLQAHRAVVPAASRTREQLFAFARFTAARNKDNGGLAIRLPDAPDRPQRRPRR